MAKVKVETAKLDSILAPVVEGGKLKIGVNMSDLAKQAGVSVQTLRRYATKAGFIVAKTRRKLTAEQVLEIRQKLAAGVPQTKLSEEYDYDDGNMSKLATGKIWKNVK